ncbi:hypothetical protein [Paraburkholderia tagetis]|uniref:Uncharacterized protein n=1 Tax=Paraburkholderia tagetis TaxID=2913261 RepID=A0A9X1RLR7_9BURK|nr:hypothetical protein [Paraburkholderia tagetis]MCG5072177.1 hypothetical protein [Paraburkholderia tagetis]
MHKRWLTPSATDAVGAIGSSKSIAPLSVCFRSALPSAEVQGKREQHDKNNENRLGEALSLFGKWAESKNGRNDCNKEKCN